MKNLGLRKEIKGVGVIGLVSLVLILLDGPFLWSQDKKEVYYRSDELKVIRRVVEKKELEEERAKQKTPRWLKMWIIDEMDSDKEIKISLPVALIDLLMVKAQLRVKEGGEKNLVSEQNDLAYLREGKWKRADLKFFGFKNKSKNKCQNKPLRCPDHSELGPVPLIGKARF